MTADAVIWLLFWIVSRKFWLFCLCYWYAVPKYMTCVDHVILVHIKQPCASWA